MANLLHRLKIKEVSSVKRGAGEGVKVVLMKMDEEPYWKRDFSQKQRDSAAKSGAAMPDGSFPIHNEEDLHNAIRLAGNAKDPAAAKKHIKARAASMGMSDAIPDTWGGTAKSVVFSGDGDDMLSTLFKAAIDHGAPIGKVAKAEVAMNQATAAIETIQGEAEQTSALETSLSQCVDHLAGLVPAEQADDFRAAVSAITEESIMPTEAEKAAALKKEEDLQKTLDEMQKSNAALTRQVAILSMSKEHQEYLSVMPFEAAELTKAQDKFIAATPEKRDEAMKAWPPKKKPGDKEPDEDDTTKAFEKALADSPVMKALLSENADLKKKDEIAAFAKEAVALGLPESHGEVMYKMAKGDKEAIKTHQQMIKSLVEQARTGKLFVEFGKDNGGDNNQPAYETIKAKAEELRKSDPKLSPQQARVKVMTDPENSELVARNKSEENARRLGRVA